jgi:hypothetical protein
MRLHRYACLLGFIAFASQMARSETIYAVVSTTSSGNLFGTLNTVTGLFTEIGVQGPNLFGMGFAPNGTLYGTDSAIPANVYTIDPATGSLATIGTSTLSIEGSTAGSDGLIYAVSGSFTNAEFFTINPSTLAQHVINPALGFGTDGLAVFSGTTFYTDKINGAGTNDDLLEAINSITGVATPIGTGLGTEIFSGVDVDGVVYGAGADGNLYTINLTTGVATLDVHISGVAGAVDALAFRPVPEPSSLPFIVTVVMAGSFLVRRFRQKSREIAATNARLER